jgi:iron complex transport system permease protein
MKPLPSSRHAHQARLFWLVAALTPMLLGLCALMGASGIGLPDWTTQPVILRLRLTRVLAGFLIGAALSCAGVTLQAILRNPLAEPYVLGISSGAALGAALAILTGFSALGVFSVPLLAFVMAVLTLAAVYRLAGTAGARPSVFGLILSGVMVSSMCSSLLMFMVSVAPIEGMHSVIWWTLGNLEVTSDLLLTVAGSVAAAGCLALWALSPELNAITLGHEMAHHLGVRVKAMIALALVLATLITAASVAVAGLIGFVGLLVPHVMRTLVGPDHRRLMPAAALGGGAFLAVCDAVARTVMNVEIPVGVVTALVGGPFFLFLLHRRRKAGGLE